MRTDVRYVSEFRAKRGIITNIEKLKEVLYKSKEFVTAKKILPMTVYKSRPDMVINKIRKIV